jgi:5-methylcytosine-specific restriction endonuclease McrA
MKQCTKCGEMQLLEAFPRLHTRSSGYNSICKVCVNDSHRAWYARVRQPVRALAHVSRKNGQTFICQQCRQPFYLAQSRIGKRGATQEWCSAACKNQGRRERSQRRCVWCNQFFHASPSALQRRLCCSHACSVAYRAVTPNATNRVSGSVVEPQPYGALWRQRRRLALERDGRICQMCGGRPSRPHVHHIVPLRYFGEDYEAAHALTNLLTLCHPCHLRMEHQSGTYALERERA